jgi:hypothetical protein
MDNIVNTIIILNDIVASAQQLIFQLEDQKKNYTSDINTSDLKKKEYESNDDAKEVLKPKKPRKPRTKKTVVLIDDSDDKPLVVQV